MQRTVSDNDSYVSKIVKYVPAESIALATGFFAAFTGLSRGGVFLAVGIFAVANFAYLLGVAHVHDKEVPSLHFYVLSAMAFLLWSAAEIDPVARAVGLAGTSSGPQRAWVLGVATGFIPLLDSAAKNRELRAALGRPLGLVRRGRGAPGQTVAPEGS
jgi:hypothetical protein